MSDPTDPQPPSGNEPAGSGHRSRSAIPVAITTELSLSTEVANAAVKAAYAPALAGEGIDAAFVKSLRDNIALGNTLVASAGGKESDKKGATLDEAKLKRALLTQIGTVQARAKRKYPGRGDPKRATYYIGKKIDSNRAQLEAASQSILETLATDTLPGLTPEKTAALAAARDAYVTAQSTQTGGVADAKTARQRLDAVVKDVAGLRRQIQLAVDALWPASEKVHSATRVEFKLSPDRAMQ